LTFITDDEKSVILTEWKK